MSALDLDDLPRRLADLADSAGPWDDPLPEIRRRARLMESTDARSTADAAAPARPGRAAARKRWRWPSWDPFTAGTVAAAVLLVVVVGWLVRTSGPGSSSKVATAESGSRADYGSSSAGAARGATSAGPGTTAAGPGGSSSAHSGTDNSSASVCGWPASSAAYALAASSTVRSGESFSVRLRRTGSGPAGGGRPTVVAIAKGRVVGRLVPAGTRIGPGTPSPTSGATVTGTLRTSTCGQVRALGPAQPRSLSAPLAPGTYQLVVVLTATHTTTVSAPVTVTVTR